MRATLHRNEIWIFRGSRDFQPAAGAKLKPQSKGEKARSEIVNCAKRLFYERGYDRTSFSDIVESSGLVRGNIYHYFKTKDDILRAVIEQRTNEIRGLLAWWDESYPTPRERLMAFIAMIAGNSGDLMEYGCPIGSLNMELGKGRRELQIAARQLFDLFQAWLAANLRALGCGDRADAQAMHLLGRAQGVAVITQVYRDATLLKRETDLLADWIDSLPATPQSS